MRHRLLVVSAVVIASAAFGILLGWPNGEPRVALTPTTQSPVEPVFEGEVPEFSLELANRSAEPVELLLTATCGCTNLAIDGNEVSSSVVVAPHSRSVLAATIQTSGSVGLRTVEIHAVAARPAAGDMSAGQPLASATIDVPVLRPLLVATPQVVLGRDLATGTPLPISVPLFEMGGGGDGSPPTLRAKPHASVSACVEKLTEPLTATFRGVAAVATHKLVLGRGIEGKLSEGLQETVEVEAERDGRQVRTEVFVTMPGDPGRLVVDPSEVLVTRRGKSWTTGHLLVTRADLGPLGTLDITVTAGLSVRELDGDPDMRRFRIEVDTQAGAAEGSVTLTAAGREPLSVPVRRLDQ